MKLCAISDLHLGYEANRQALAALPYYSDAWLILAGDVCETEMQFEFALSVLARRFAQIVWTPGNHELWTLPGRNDQWYGEAKYQRLVTLCRNHGVWTPEDPYPLWPGDGTPLLLAPTFLLYDYSSRPDDVPEERAVAWAEETGVVCTDEFLLYPDPYPSRTAWCAARCHYTEPRLQAAAATAPMILINHFPLRSDLVRLRYIPRFSLWCGTRRTEDWHTRFPVRGVIYGHLHIRGTNYRDGVWFEEVSLGYPQQWDPARGVRGYLRQILPGSVVAQAAEPLRASLTSISGGVGRPHSSQS